MRISKLVKGMIGTAVLALLLAPMGAQAQSTDNGNFSFFCPGCTTAGNAWTGHGGNTYKFAVTTDGQYTWDATASAGDLFVFYFSTDPNVYGSAATQFAMYSSLSANEKAPLVLTSAFEFQNGVQYYISATATCTDASQACNVTLIDPTRIGGGGGPDNVVPEPISMVLLGTGLFGIAGVRRRRRIQELEKGV